MTENWRGNVCPRCGGADHIDVAATVWVRLTNDGSDADESMNGDHEYDDDSDAQCNTCGYKGKLASFSLNALKKVKTYSVTITEQLCTYRAITVTVEAEDCDKAAELAKAQAYASLEWTEDHDTVDIGHTDFEVSAPDEPTHSWRED